MSTDTTAALLTHGGCMGLSLIFCLVMLRYFLKAIKDHDELFAKSLEGLAKSIDSLKDKM